MNEEEIIQKFETIEKRLNFLEGKKQITDKVRSNGEQNYSGLTGGIRFLIKTGFFNELKSVAEIFEKLKNEGYHYPNPSVDKLLRVDFMKNSKILNRVRENNRWKYVLRK